MFVSFMFNLIMFSEFCEEVENVKSNQRTDGQRKSRNHNSALESSALKFQMGHF